MSVQRSDLDEHVNAQVCINTFDFDKNFGADPILADKLSFTLRIGKKNRPKIYIYIYIHRVWKKIIGNDAIDAHR